MANFIHDNVTLPVRYDDKPVQPNKVTTSFSAADLKTLTDALYDTKAHTSGWVNVRSYGAKGDGVSDDTAAIQAAINSLPLATGNAPYYSPSTAPNGGTLLLPHGSYKISAPLTFNRGIRIRGEGSEATRILSFSASGVFVSQPTGSYVPNAVEVSGLSIWQDASVPATSGAAIDVLKPTGSLVTDYKATRLTVSDVIAEGTYYGLRLVNGIGSTVRDSVFSKTVSHGVYVPGPVAWAGGYLYYVGMRAVNGGNLYECITQGTTAASPGPSGTGSDITDGTAHWKYVEARPASVMVTTSTTFDRVYAYLSQSGDGFRLEGTEYTALFGCASDSNKGWGYVLHGGVSTSIYASGSEQNGKGGALLFFGSAPFVNLRVVEGASSVDYTPSCTRNGVELLYVTRAVLGNCAFTGTDAVQGYGIKYTSSGPYVDFGTVYNGTYFTKNVENHGLSLTPGTGVNGTFVGGDVGRYAMGTSAPDTTATLLLGGSTPLRLGTKDTGPAFYTGAGSPEGGISAKIGSVYLNSSGGASTTLYVKASGDGTNTGWVAK